MVKGLVILSVLLNLALVGGGVAYYMMRESDAVFFVDYNRMTPAQREIIRQANNTVKEKKISAQQEYEELLIDDSFRDKYSTVTSPGAAQELLVESTRLAVRNQNARLEHAQASVERFAMRTGEYRDIEDRIFKSAEQLQADRDAFEREKKDWETLQLDEFLNQLVADIDKTEDGYSEVAARVAGRPTIQQAYVLRKLKNGIARTAIEAALPAEERANLKAYTSRVYANTIGSAGADSTTANR